MGKKYVMFVDERGFLSTDRINNFSMIGVIFEHDYCMDLKNKQCELKTKIDKYKEEVFGKKNINIFLDDIIVNEKVLKKYNEAKRKEFLDGLPFLFKGLKFTIISSTIKQDIKNIKESYDIATNNLFKNFNSFIVKKNGECGTIIMEARDSKTRYTVQQSFFDVYNERNLSMSEDMENKINAFIVSEKDNEKYGLGIEISNILNNIFFRVSNGLREFDSKLMSYIEYGNTDKIFNVIKHKIYKDTAVQISHKQLEKISYNSIETFNKELKTLKEQLEHKDTKISQKEKEISELSNEIHFLNQQLEEALLSRKNDSIIFQILSDIDFKMKRIEKKALVAKN
ncbi:hypothetical protein psyc5s11_37280 [Clostridium gelidum]|uniref:DUF3800 domain-containing protein n=1 Tax=Clostridium gelidum TaxID=704125 RepID=A0ABN6IZX2_9CLOT|nr:DUF3800 domain-containing protein [Clostridium gelidum]BCZ47661.1 hypothetical protein psyc5s11_37280 [Clostridium gelidum]